MFNKAIKKYAVWVPTCLTHVLSLLPKFLGCEDCSGNIWKKLLVVLKGKHARACLAMPVRKSGQGPEAVVRSGA